MIPICVLQLVVEKHILDCQGEECPLWDSLFEKCDLVKPNQWAKLPHDQRRSNVK